MKNLPLTHSGLGEDKTLVWVEGDAEALKFEDDSMDGYTIAFGIRNVTHIEKALSEAHRFAPILCSHSDLCFMIWYSQGSIVY